MTRFALIILLGITPLCFAVDTDFASETERDITGLYNQLKGVEVEANKIKVQLAKLHNHRHEDIDERLRYLEAETQKAQAALGIVRWLLGAVLVCVPIIGFKAYRR